MNGFMVVDKPSGITSHDVVNFMRRKFQMRRVGHAGTLDPLATGVLVILFGKDTKLFDKFADFDKAYEATLKLGMTTDTADIEGKVLKELPFAEITQEHVEEVFKQFIGDTEQVPPMVSALKVGGKKLYQFARQGIVVAREPRKIKIHALRLMDFSSPQVKFYLECSKGTYVRQLAEDVGKVLGCGGCITQIRRTKVGPFLIDQAVNLEKVHENHLRHWQD